MSKNLISAFTKPNIQVKANEEDLGFDNPWQPQPPNDQERNEYISAWLDSSVLAARVSINEQNFSSAKLSKNKPISWRWRFSKKQRMGELPNSNQAFFEWQGSRQKPSVPVHAESHQSLDVPKNSVLIHAESRQFLHVPKELDSSKLLASSESNFATTLHDKSARYLHSKISAALQPNNSLHQKPPQDHLQSLGEVCFDADFAHMPRTPEKVKSHLRASYSPQTLSSERPVISELEAMSLVDFSDVEAIQKLSNQVGDSICAKTIEYSLGKIDVATLRQHYFENMAFVNDLQTRLARFTFINPQAYSTFERSTKILRARMSHIKNALEEHPCTVR